MDGHLFRLSGTTAELRGGKFTHYAVDQFRHWKPCKLSGHGQVVVSVKLCDTTYSTLNLASPGVGRTVRLHVEACPDSGAMMVMCGPRQVEDMCFSTSDLLLPNTDIKTVDGTTAKVLEGLFVEISGYDKHREEVLSKLLVYCMEAGGVRQDLSLQGVQYPAWHTGPRLTAHWGRSEPGRPGWGGGPG